MNAIDAVRFSDNASCPHMLGNLPCMNPAPHKGGGRGCIHVVGSWVPRSEKEE